MNILQPLILLSSFSFVIYVVAYFSTPKLKIEFIRFGLERYGNFIAVIELCGTAGLLVGLVSNELLVFSSAGLALLMLLAVAVRVRFKDRIGETIPALLLMLLNVYIFYRSIAN
jgi:hypothetical protein